MVKRIQISDTEYWILLGLKVKFKTDTLLGVLQALGVDSEEAIQEDLSETEQQIYEFIKYSPRTTEEIQSMLGVTRGRIAQIMSGKNGHPGLLKKRKDIVRKNISHTGCKYRYSINKDKSECVEKEEATPEQCLECLVDDCESRIKVRWDKTLEEQQDRMVDCDIGSIENNEDDDVNNPKNFDTLTEQNQTVLLDWIKKYLKPSKRINSHHTSYGLKHVFEDSEGGFYTTNGQFKGAMLKAGFEPQDRDHMNWRFKVSEKSIREANSGE